MIVRQSGVPIPHQFIKLKFDPRRFVAQAFKPSLHGKVCTTGVRIRLKPAQERRTLHSAQSQTRFQHLDFQFSDEDMHDKSYKTPMPVTILE